ncbi:apolipoprotein N-acyltransferase [Rhodomicrobium sp. R_RK_3]|uniref:apolipoprotein N-acyltransferase n=1 Tax=Rhodomicrobium TaxID=1068 RepID=UPI000B4B9312|nr:apolipoprotein N-acyltransferase [Rhodomicrobium sp. R_RK_3]
MAIGLGAVSVLAFAPFHLWPLLFLTFPGLVWLLDGIAAENGTAKPRWRQAAFAGWCFGFGFFVAGLYWMGFAFFVEADKFAWLMPFAVAALPAGLALFYALACAAAMRLWRPGIARIFILAAALFAAEWLRGNILTGFPWNLWGYALAGNDALSQSASIFGIYGLTLLALLIFASPAALAGCTARPDARNWPLPALCLGLLAIGWGWGTLRLAPATDVAQPGVTLRIVQANIPQAEKWKPENRKRIFERLLSLSSEPSEQGGPITHLIWPETSVPFLFMLNGAIALPDARDAFATLVPEGSSLILGAERVEGTARADGRYNVDRVFNSLFILDPEAKVLGTYDKLHLVPFGEYVPFETALTALGIKQLTHMNTGFASGATRRLMTAPGAPPFSPLICYEAIFPGQINAEDGRPQWLLNLTNDAWFGISTGPYQHLQQVRLRAVEQGLPLIRAANTGISAIIDAHGRIAASLPLGAIGHIDHALPAALAATPYARWGDFWLILVAFLIFVLYRVLIIVE